MPRTKRDYLEDDDEIVKSKRQGDDDDDDEEEDEEEETSKAVQEAVFDEQVLLTSIRDIVSKSIAEEIAPILRKQAKLTKALSETLMMLDDIKEQQEEIEKGMKAAAEGSELFKSIIEQATNSGKQVPASKDATPVTTALSEIMQKATKVGDPRETNGASPNRAEAAELAKKARQYRDTLQKSIPGYTLEVVNKIRNLQDLSDSEMESLRKGVTEAEQALQAA